MRFFFPNLHILFLTKFAYFLRQYCVFQLYSVMLDKAIHQNITTITTTTQDTVTYTHLEQLIGGFMPPAAQHKIHS